MRAPNRESAQLGELIAAVYAIAEQYSTDPKVISRLATKVVHQMVSRAGRTMDAKRRAMNGVSP